MSIAVEQEAREWCALPQSINANFRSLRLRPPMIFLENPLSFLIERGGESVVSIVEAICLERRNALHEMWPSRNSAVAKGRILLTTAVNESVVDGASCDASAGWFDGNDLPPWDTWIAYRILNNKAPASEYALVSLVPEAWESRVQAGIVVNPVDCIAWATVDDLRALERR
jgi:hypothetical protein